MADVPAGIRPTDSNLRIKFNTQTFDSPLTGSSQSASLPGDRWLDVVSFGPLVDSKARAFKAWILGLKGTTVAFNFSPPDLNQQGVGTASITVDGAGQLGGSLNIQTTDLNTLVFGVGDYLSVNGEMKSVQADVTTNGSGLATVTFVPPLRRAPPDSAPIEFESPTVTMKLEDNEQGQFSISTPIIYNTSISLVEFF